MTVDKTLSGKIGKIQGKSILVIGDVGLDEYVNGQVKRISPEAPVPIVEVARRESRLGLASNVAQNISSLGGDCLLVSVIGDDVAGKEICELLEKANVSANHLIVDESRPTTQKLRVMSEHHHVVRVDFEKRKFLSADVEKKLLEKVSDLLPKADTVILQDYAKGVISESLAQEIIRLSHDQGKIVLVDPNKFTPIKTFKGADILTPNWDEALAISHVPTDNLYADADQLDIVGRKILSESNAKQLVVTLGKDGMCLFEGDQSEIVPTFARDVYDVTGAGDTVIAALALSFAAGFSLKESCLVANHAAGIVVAQVGCVPCRFDELKSNLEGS